VDTENEFGKCSLGRDCNTRQQRARYSKSFRFVLETQTAVMVTGGVRGGNSAVNVLRKSR
jgi:hypothetical protein